MPTEISRTSTMQQILQQFPSAQRALFQRYHVGGCSSCGFQPSDTLEEVCLSHNLPDVDEVIQHILTSHETDQKIEISAADTAVVFKEGIIKLLDVRTEEEWQIAHIEGARLVTEQLGQELMTQWPKETPIVLHCHHGVRSLDAASYLLGHGFTNVRSMSGGIEAWSRDVDPSVPRY